MPIQIWYSLLLIYYKGEITKEKEISFVRKRFQASSYDEATKIAYRRGEKFMKKMRNSFSEEVGFKKIDIQYDYVAYRMSYNLNLFEGEQDPLLVGGLEGVVYK